MSDHEFNPNVNCDPVNGVCQACYGAKNRYLNGDTLGNVQAWPIAHHYSGDLLGFGAATNLPRHVMEKVYARLREAGPWLGWRIRFPVAGPNNCINGYGDTLADAVHDARANARLLRGAAASHLHDYSTLIDNINSDVDDFLTRTEGAATAELQHKTSTVDNPVAKAAAPAK